ncbi:MAG: TolC family protein [Nitrospinae bacterium]|nr:TolC family protein [Nitrospinota bacterium]
MRTKQVGMGLAIAIAFLLAGCAGVQTDKEWGRVETFVKERAGAKARWEQTKEDGQATHAEVNAMLADGLTRKEAVQIAILNNRTLQAAFEELGVAKADLVQAGFFTNPRIDGLVRFPTKGGGTNVEAGGLVNLADLWQIPLRKRLAKTRLEAATLRVTDEVLNTVAEAKGFYDDILALAAARDETARVLKALEDLRDRIAQRKEHGYTSDFDVAFARAAVFDQKAALVRVEGELRVASTRLSRVLGLTPEQAGYTLTGSLPDDIGGPIPDTETLVTHALAQRPDVQLAELEISISERAMALEQARVFTDIEAGAAFEREAEGGELVGPALGLQLPVFDQNQAQIAKAAYRVRQAQKQRQALVGMVYEEVAAAAERLAVARQDAMIIRDQVLPAYQDAIDYAEKYSGAMQLNMLFLLEARKEQVASSRRYIDALREARAAEVDLERALGGVMPKGAMQSSMKHGHAAMPHVVVSAKGRAAAGKAIYQRLCASCHGASGKGDGPVGRSLTPKPIDFTVHSRHHNDEYFFKAIQEGGPAVGKSPVMPAWGGQLKDEEIWDVISYIRALVKGEGEAGGDMPAHHPHHGGGH